MSRRSARPRSCRGRHELNLPPECSPPSWPRFLTPLSPYPRSTDVVAPAHHGIPHCAQHYWSCDLPAGPVRSAVPWDCRYCCHLLPVHSRDHPVRAVHRARGRDCGRFLHSEHRANARHRNRERPGRSLICAGGTDAHGRRKGERLVDLPTYTNIWRIEKRLYKLYDFRLPMPLPVGQIAVFLAIAVPYVGVLALIGLPFSHTLLWLYVLPPGVLAWLTTRPVLESKKLPELVHSQLRYLLEPRTWCRMAALAEKEEITLTARIWRRAEPAEDPELAP